MRYIEYLQIPYQHQGRTFKGADCFGILRLFYEKELDITLQDYDKPYEQEWWVDQNLMLDLYKEYNFKKVKTFDFGNVILFKNTSSTPGHIGIVLEDGKFLHMTRTGAAINSYIMGAWNKMIHSVYKQKKVRNAPKGR